MASFSQYLTKLTFFIHTQTLYDVMHTQIENLEFVQGANFDFMVS